MLLDTWSALRATSLFIAPPSDTRATGGGQAAGGAAVARGSGTLRQRSVPALTQRSVSMGFPSTASTCAAAPARSCAHRMKLTDQAAA